MTRSQFLEYLASPEKLNGSSISSLEKLVQEYPYFQLGRMLYLKNLHNENSIDYEKNLHVTSAYAPSGKVLYNLIKKRIPKKEVVNRQLAPDSYRNGNENQAFEEAVVMSEQPKEALPELQPTAVLQEMPVVIKEEKKDKSDDMNPDSYRYLEKEMLREAYRVSMTVDLLQEENKRDRSNPDSYPDKSEQPLTISPQPSAISQSYSFNDWMKVVSGKTPETTKEEKALETKQKNQILDSFLLQEIAKSTPKTKTEFYSAEVMAKKSLQDNENFITETLAKIYLKQGNLPKALRSYEILLVKYPEKFHIFAPLLEKIKNLIKEQKKK